MKQQTVFLAILAGLLGACTKPPADPPGPERIGGCYRLRYAAPENGADSTLFAARVELAPGAAAGQVQSIGFANDSLNFWRMFAGDGRWERTRTGLELWFSNGFSSVQYQLTPRGDSLIGHATVHYDVVEAPRPRMRVMGLPCSQSLAHAN